MRILLLLLSISLNASTLRDVHKPIVALPDEAKVVVLSPPESGGEYIYNIIEYLFEDVSFDATNTKKRVQKSEDYNHFIYELDYDPHTHCVVAIRNPSDSFSAYVQNSDVISDAVVRKLLPPYVQAHARATKLIKEGAFDQVLALQYEQFSYGLYSIISKIETFFSCTIPHSEQVKIRLNFRQTPSESKLEDLKGKVSEEYYEKLNEKMRIVKHLWVYSRPDNGEYF